MLSQATIDGIRESLAAGELAQWQIAAKFGCSISSVRNVVSGKVSMAKRPPSPLPPPAAPTAVVDPATRSERAAGSRPAAPPKPSEEFAPKVSTWHPAPLPTLQAAAERSGLMSESDEAGVPGPLAQLVMKLKIHVENRNFEPVRRLLRDPDLRVLSVALVHADGKQWDAVERLMLGYECGVDPGLSLDSWLSEAGLPVRVVNYLEQAGFTTFATLAGVPRSRLEAIPGFGPKMIDVVVEALGRAKANTDKLETAGAKNGEWGD